MSTAVPTAPRQSTRETTFASWTTVAWFGALVLLAYGPLLTALVVNWSIDEDMGHAFFVPVIAAYIAWQKRSEIANVAPKPTWVGLLVLGWAAIQLYLATLGAELFLSRTAFVISIIGLVLLLGGFRYLKTFAFPLFLLFFMVPIPAIIYNGITFPLQIFASEAGESALSLLQIPVLREGNVLVLPSQTLNVVEACSGIRSLLTLTFLSVVYGYFFERRTWIRIVLFCATIPIAIIANAGRVTLTGVLSEINPEYAEGFFHTASGWVIFMVALLTLIAFHQLIVQGYGLINGFKRRHN